MLRDGFSVSRELLPGPGALKGGLTENHLAAGRVNPVCNPVCKKKKPSNSGTEPGEPGV